MIELTNTSMLGALIEYITYPGHKNFQPINANWGITKEVVLDKKRMKDKKYKNEIRSNNALGEIKQVLETIKGE